MVIGIRRSAGLLALIAALAAAARAQPSLSVASKSRAIAPGELLVLTITTASPASSVHVTGLGREFPAFREGPATWRALVGLDLDVPAGPAVLTIASGATPAERTTYKFVVAAKTFPARRLSVDPAFVNPPAEVQPRIKADTERINTAYRSSSAERLWSGEFVRPVAEAANSAFGTRSVFNGESRNPHSGADFASPAGTPVHAPNAGRVLIAADLYFTGNTVLIDHGLGLFSMFAHLQSIDVREGDTVATGRVLGRVGATGRVTGPHLHWSVRVNGARVDPMSLLATLGK
ncbi:MAG TPA: M23 family metallopeptidase [Vicinamibacterales bacterium]|nr:M23 family metallopeptidase [Vicinamibacterales bacterium]